MSSLFILALIGYDIDADVAVLLKGGVKVTFYFLTSVLFIKILGAYLTMTRRRWQPAEMMLFLYLLLIGIFHNVYDRSLIPDLIVDEWVYLGIWGIFVIELSKKSLSFDQFDFNPTLLFVFSFLFLILLGTSLLMLPRSLVEGRLNLVDAVFMATSAVCVTGLSVVDVGSRFTGFGQGVILVLIQLGALGVMTFTGFFGYFFSGGFSFKNQLMFTEFLSEKKTAAVTGFLLRIILMTLLLELAGAVLIYYSLNPVNFSTGTDRIYFAVFHSISAFCNAGFSTLSYGLYDESVRFNYVFQMVIAFLIIFGGLGFAVILNGYDFVKRWTLNFYYKLLFRQSISHKAWVISFNSRLVFYTTLALIVVGTCSHLVFEYHNSLASHPSPAGKLVTSFFAGVTPRTAGFNTIDMSSLSQPAIMVTLLLMWIGASPASTGGGIRTTTFAVAILNVLSIAKGSSHITVFRREVSADSLRRSYAIIFLSIVFLGLSVILLSVTEGDAELLPILFECFSAYSTVGLSLGITPELSQPGRLVLIFSMFIGRVGSLTFLIALIRNFGIRSYRYPSEQVSF